MIKGILTGLSCEELKAYTAKRRTGLNWLRRSSAGFDNRIIKFQEP